jgi:Phage capsid family
MMSKEKISSMQAQGQAAVQRAKDIAAVAEKAGREMTVSEKASYEGEVAAAGDWLRQIREGRDDLAIIAKTREISDAIGAPLGEAGITGTAGPHGKDRRLSFASMGKAAAAQISAGASGGQKALATGGSIVTGQSFIQSPVALGQVATSILDVVEVTAQASDQFAYLRQSVRTNAAAIVPEGAVKPTSTYSVVRVEDRLDVVAHLSEAIPRFWIVDNVALEQFLRNELEFGLSLAVQNMLVSDVAGTSGVQTQAYSTSVLQTLRKTLTKLEVSGYVPGSIWVNPTDFEAVELALSTVNAVEHVGLPYDASARRLWGAPLVVSTAVAAGVSYTVAAGAVGVNVDSQGVQTTWSESSNADDWSKNLIRARCEGRYATSVFAPLGIVIGDLTA